MYLKGVFSLLLLTCLILHKPPLTDGARILAAYIFPGKSHFMMHNTLIRELVKRGHEVTYLTPFSLAKENLGQNYTEVLIPVCDFWSDIHKLFQVTNLFDLANLSALDFMKMASTIGIRSTEFALQQPQIQEIINAKVVKGQYDLLLAEQFFNEAILGLAYKFNIPIVTTCTFSSANFLSQMVGIISPWSYVPHAYLPYSDRMSFMQRLENTFVSLYEDMYRKFVYFPQQDALVQQYFSHLPVTIPNIQNIEHDISVILVNSYTPMLSARPTAFNMIPVGGLHIYPPKPLPNNMQKFLDEAHAGAIYFSLGTQVQSSDMPPEKLEIFLKVFRSLKQRVLWKFEDDNLPNLPSNVLVQKWLPQSDILAHPNVKVFITHGGLFGTQEGVHYGVPMLGFPIYCDQHLNMNKAVQGGYALSQPFQSITETKLRESLLALLENPKYMENMARVSHAFRDRPMDVRDTAVYWMEYVIRQKGARHMRSAGVDLAWYQFYLLDIIAMILSAIVVLLITLYFILCKFHKKSEIKLKRS